MPRARHPPDAVPWFRVLLDEIRRRLSAYAHKRIPAEGVMKQAAVAAVLRERESDGVRIPELLFIRRAEHPKDPWSGHMAFPGGRVDRDDTDALAAAIRETREELALDLIAHGARIGELSHLIAMAHGKPLPMIITPYVFHLERTPELVPSHEVAEALWVPLSFFRERSNRSTLEWTFAGASLTLPCYRYEGRTIWGLTLKMLDELIEVIER
jgi:8-oxo-dGTP pyrophosphatase MutT (NUDIX family)